MSASFGKTLTVRSARREKPRHGFKKDRVFLKRVDFCHWRAKKYRWGKCMMEGAISSDWLKFLAQKKFPLEVWDVEALSGLRDLLDRPDFQKQGPHLLLAEEGEIKKFQSFLRLKPLKNSSCFELPPFSLNGGGVSERFVQKRRGWQAVAARSSGIFLSAPHSLLKKTSLKTPLVQLKKGDFFPDMPSLGYKKRDFAENPCEFARRGFICDIFSPAYSSPLRVELSGDKVAELHLLDRRGKKRVRPIDSALLPFAGEWLSEGGELQNLCRRLKKEGCGKEALWTFARGKIPPGFEILRNILDDSCSLDWFTRPPRIWIYEPETLKEKFTALEEEFSRLPPPFRFKNVYLPWNRLEKERITYLYRGSFKKASFDSPAPPLLSPVWSYPCLKIQKPLKEFLQKTNPSVVVWVSDGSFSESAFPGEQNLQEESDFSGQKTPPSDVAPYIKDLPESFLQKSLFLQGDLEESFINISEGTAWLKAKDLRSSPGPSAGENSFEFFKQKASALNFADLKEGELAVHRKHGLGRFHKLQTLETGGVREDYIVLIYKKGDRLLIPAHRADEIKRYAAYFPKDPSALLDRLGDPRLWERKKQKVTKHIQALTLELMEIYRARKSARRPPFKPVQEELDKFAADFPFKETPGQTKAVSEIMEDMNREYPMERLLSADVGFGKTEVALRAVFRALQNGFQVCWIAPTTVLSLQHYENFKERFRNQPFKPALLNRFLKPKDREKLLDRLKRGEVNFLVATHGVFSSSVKFKNPGLFVIDEEHRFGVSHKDKLHRLRNYPDILSLSATPIPRTLNMALSGIRDVSVLSHPPSRRKPVHISTEKWNPSLIKKACDFERARAGQILFVHNRVKSIGERERELRDLLPDYKIALATGQMPPARLEDILIRFFQREFDLLLSTNIVESGMDMPTANTLFVDRVSTLGLSQLYQLKGRVGRGESQAYCYFLLPERGEAPATTMERLHLLERYGDLGGGFHLALHDMEARGAGELFGGRQSGFINTVGQELYFELLKENLSLKKGEGEGLFPPPEIKLPLSTCIPSSYVPDVPLRLFYYKSLSESSVEALRAVRREMEYNFGPLPPETENLFSLLKIRKTGRRLGLREMKTAGGFLCLSFQEEAPLPVEKIVRAVQSRGWQMRSEHSVKIPLPAGERNLFKEITAALKEFSP